MSRGANTPMEFEYSSPNLDRVSSRTPPEVTAAPVFPSDVNAVSVPAPISTSVETAANWSPADVQQITDQVMRMLDRRIVEHRERMGHL